MDIIDLKNAHQKYINQKIPVFLLLNKDNEFLEQNKTKNIRRFSNNQVLEVLIIN